MSHQEDTGFGRNEGAASNGTGNARDTAIRGPARPGPYIAGGILLGAAILLPLMPQLYSFDAPRLAGIPYFYWYQLLWVPVSAALTGTAYWLFTKEDRRRRAEARAAAPGLPNPGSAGSGSRRERP